MCWVLPIALEIYNEKFTALLVHETLYSQHALQESDMAMILTTTP